jgi:hypothetical protein
MALPTSTLAWDAAIAPQDATFRDKCLDASFTYVRGIAKIFTGSHNVTGVASATAVGSCARPFNDIIANTQVHFLRC